jgi:ADP-heptose:LPS heptosyltransferase
MAHLAAAYTRPAVTLCGPVPPKLCGPPGRPWHAVLWAGQSGDPHASVPDPGLLRIPVSGVLSAARRVLAAAGTRGRAPASR